MKSDSLPDSENNTLSMAESLRQANAAKSNQALARKFGLGFISEAYNDSDRKAVEIKTEKSPLKIFDDSEPEQYFDVTDSLHIDADELAKRAPEKQPQDASALTLFAPDEESDEQPGAFSRQDRNKKRNRHDTFAEQIKAEKAAGHKLHHHAA